MVVISKKAQHRGERGSHQIGVLVRYLICT